MFSAWFICVTEKIQACDEIITILGCCTMQLCLLLVFWDSILGQSPEAKIFKNSSSQTLLSVTKENNLHF